MITNKSKFRISRIVLIVFLAVVLFDLSVAQDGSGQGGTRSNFTFGFGARAMGMGNAFVALADDPTALYWNPAGLDYIYQQSLTFFHASLPEGGLYDFLGYAYPTLDLGTFALGIGRIGTGGIEEFDIVRVDATGSIFLLMIIIGSMSGYGLKLPWNLSGRIVIKSIASGLVWDISGGI